MREEELIQDLMASQKDMIKLLNDAIENKVVVLSKSGVDISTNIELYRKIMSAANELRGTLDFQERLAYEMGVLKGMLDCVEFLILRRKV